MLNRFIDWMIDNGDDAIEFFFKLVIAIACGGVIATAMVMADKLIK
ncbi:hypothetical protein AGMMS50239_39740 [Bacteroidia bacterium]|nr:hypothetical protein AGMMS50239_39740 [Bacteroidia bacterium]